MKAMRKILDNKLFFTIVLFGIILSIVILNTSQNTRERQIFSNVFSPFNEKKMYSQEPPIFEYIEIVDSCGPYFEGICVNVRKGPSIESEVVTRLRNGIVLKVIEKIVDGGEVWYKISFNDEWLRYGERVSKDWYVSAAYTRHFFDEGIKESHIDVVASSTKYIVIDRSDQKLYAYENKILFAEESISTGIELSPTPRGIFHIYKKTPSRYMQGPIPDISEKEYDLPGVPWNLYFTEQGAVIHGAYWHDKFGQPWSSGCVNLQPEKAKKIYMWADLGTEVLVRD